MELSAADAWCHACSWLGGATFSLLCLCKLAGKLWLCVQVDLCALSLEALFVVLRLVFQPGGWAWWDLAFLALKSFTISAALLAHAW